MGVVARSLREVARGRRVQALLLARSDDLICKNLMCEHVGSSCACKLSLVLERVPDLREMDLSHNQLRFLPASTFALAQLTHLNVGHNLLDVLPTELVALRHLEVLDIGHNRIKVIPEDTILQLEHLKEIRVTGNPLVETALSSLRSRKPSLKIIE